MHRLFNYFFSFIFFLFFAPNLIQSQSRDGGVFDTTYTEYFRLNSGGWTAGDATISVPLPDGRVIWLFGDSYTVAVNLQNNTLPCLFQVRNCFMVQNATDPASFKTILDTTSTGVNMTTFKLRSNDTSIFWPGHGYVHNDTVYIFLERYDNATLEYEGCYLAKLTYPDLHQVTIVKAQATPVNYIYGRAVIADEQANKLYIYGNHLNWIVWEPVLARCDLSNPLLPWEYYTGSGWSSIGSQAQKIGNDPVSPGFSVFEHEGYYYLITQENGYLECGLGREIYSYKSVTPWGPFSGQKLLYTEESKINGNYLLTYNAQAHPWNIEDNQLLVCYNVNDRVDTQMPYVCPSQCQNVWTDRMDADSYRPKFIRVPMDLVMSDGNLGQPFNQQTIHLHVVQQPVSKNSVFQLEVSSHTPTGGMLMIYDLSGRAVDSNSLHIEGGKAKFDLVAPDNPGIYFLEYADKEIKSNVVKLVVR